MEQRAYYGQITPEALAQSLLGEWDRDDTIAQAFGEQDRVVVQIGQREGGWFSDEPHQALTLAIEAIEGGVQVTMGQQQWYKDSGAQFIGGGLIGFFPFFFAFPLGQIFGGGSEIDSRLPGRVWQSIERFVATQGAATGKTRRLPTTDCPECGVSNPQGATHCSACGTNLSVTPTCGRCGHTNPPGARFCNQCGAGLNH
jgi:ribosomal protein L40E